MGMYLDPTKALKRLRHDWDSHGSLIVAVDYDSTLIPYMDAEKQYMQKFEDVRQLVRDLKLLGCTIIIFTASDEARHPEIHKTLEEIKVPYDLFNKSPDYIPNIGRTGKVYANAYLDDRAGLAEVFGHLQQLVTEIKLKSAENIMLSMAERLANC